MRYELLIKNEFWNDLYMELDNTKNRVFMQFMTFEGDETGLKLANKLIELRNKGIEVKVLIDRYNDYFISTKYYNHTSVEEEVIRTSKMIEEMTDCGIEIKRTRPFGSPMVFFLARNHKKIIVIDDVCYLGGINISDHNFEWHDFMVKINDKDLVNAVAEDFSYTYSGKENDFKYKNIITNKYLEKTYYDLIKNAKKEIIISSPYIIDLHLVKILKEKKIEKLLLTLKDNNYKLYNFMSDYLYSLLTADDTKVFHYTYFSHAKFLIVDRKLVFIGSSNFGTESFMNKQEIGIVILDEKFVSEFISKMFTENMKYLETYKPPQKRFGPQRLLTHLIYYLMLFYGKTFAKLVKPIG